MTIPICSDADAMNKALGKMIENMNEVMWVIDNTANQVAIGSNQVSAVVQTNATTAEENSAASEEMAAQADMLHQEVQQFTLRSIDDALHMS